MSSPGDDKGVRRLRKAVTLGKKSRRYGGLNLTLATLTLITKSATSIECCEATERIGGMASIDRLRSARNRPVSSTSCIKRPRTIKSNVRSLIGR